MNGKYCLIILMMAIFTFLYDSDNVNALTMNEKNSLE